jgi:carboxymethylenebutenolidase
MISEAYRGRLRADLYLPERAHGPSVVLVHGGGFVIGSRRMQPMRFVASQLAAAGIAVCSIDYRKMLRLAEAVDDVRAALAFWRARTAQLGLSDHISLVGLSAGATLSLLAAARDPVARVACCFGLYEVDHLPRVFPRLLFRTADRSAWRFDAHPTAPTLLLHGDADRLVPVTQAHRLAAQREALGLPTRLVIYPGARHGFLRRASPVAEVAVRELAAHVGSA